MSIVLQNYKRLILCLALMFLACALAGCGQAENTEDSGSLVVSPVETIAPENADENSANTAPPQSEVQEQTNSVVSLASLETEPTDFVDLTYCFSAAADESTGEAALKSIICGNLSDDEVALSDELYTLESENCPYLDFTASWYHSGETLYFGLINSALSETYCIPLTGGGASGQLSLESLPRGDYYVIAFSDSNPEVWGIVNYEINTSER